MLRGRAVCSSGTWIICWDDVNIHSFIASFCAPAGFKSLYFLKSTEHWLFLILPVSLIAFSLHPKCKSAPNQQLKLKPVGFLATLDLKPTVVVVVLGFFIPHAGWVFDSQATFFLLHCYVLPKRLAHCHCSWQNPSVTCTSGSIWSGHRWGSFESGRPLEGEWTAFLSALTFSVNHVRLWADKVPH